MDKFEFSDLYKFLVSAGIVLIGLAILLPWFYLKEPFDLLIESNKILLLTKVAQKIVIERQIFVGNISSIIPYLSLFLFLLGLGCMIFGLIKWFKKQADIDVRDLLTTQKLKNEVKAMTNSEVDSKNETEFEEVVNVSSDNDQNNASRTTTTTTVPPTKNNFISSYLQIEQFFNNRLTSIFQNKYKILANVRMDKSVLAEYDLVLSSSSPSNVDYIFEFKYYPNGVTKVTVRDVMMRLDWKSKIYSDNIKNNVKPILLIVLPPERFNPERFIELKKITDEVYFINKNIKVDFINIQNLDDLDKSYFENLLAS